MNALLFSRNLKQSINKPVVFILFFCHTNSNKQIRFHITVVVLISSGNTSFYCIEIREVMDKKSQVVDVHDVETTTPLLNSSDIYQPIPVYVESDVKSYAAPVVQLEGFIQV